METCLVLLEHEKAGAFFKHTKKLFRTIINRTYGLITSVKLCLNL